LLISAAQVLMFSVFRLVQTVPLSWAARNPEHIKSLLTDDDDNVNDEYRYAAIVWLKAIT